MITFPKATLLALLACTIEVAASRAPTYTRSTFQNDIANETADLPDLMTWWHASGEINTQSPVGTENVRQSHMYLVQVRPAGTTKFYDSFVYETIPRSGKGQICYPDDYETICPEDDGVSIEDDVGVTMGWSQFLYGSDVEVKVTRRDGREIAASAVTVRPTTLDFEISEENGSAIIQVPHTPETEGTRFSVEIDDDIWEYRNAGPGPDSHYVQNVNPSGDYYVESYDDSMPIVGREPRNALLIFASPFPAADLVPSDVDDVYEVEPGYVTGLDAIDKPVVSFGPGVYDFSGKAHANLSPSVTWVYIAPGAYVKGAIQYNNGSSPMKASGFGVLSGEQYVYQANTAERYSNTKSDLTSLKLWRGDGVTSGQTWRMHGLTTNAPPFNVMDFYGELDDFSVHVSDYKQVGSFYGQTDGMQMYPHGHVHDVFYHVGDDGIKTYYSNVLAERFTVWKTNNAPIIQMGWYSRHIGNIVIDNLNIIHSRYSNPLSWAPRALIGSSSSYLDTDSTDTANMSTTISNYTVSNVRAEGLSPALIGLNMLSNIDNFLVDNVWIEEFVPATTEIDVSAVRGFTDRDNDNKKVTVGANSPDGLGLVVRGYRVGDEEISFAAENWNATSSGRLYVDEEYWGNWTVV